LPPSLFWGGNPGKIPEKFFLQGGCALFGGKFRKNFRKKKFQEKSGKENGYSGGYGRLVAWSGK
jgi:hypothetical protein